MNQSSRLRAPNLGLIAALVASVAIVIDSSALVFSVSTTGNGKLTLALVLVAAVVVRFIAAVVLIVVVLARDRRTDVLHSGDMPDRQGSGPGAKGRSRHRAVIPIERKSMKHIKFATVVVGAVGAPLLGLGIGAGVASANTDTNPTTNDAMGFGVQNAMRDWQGIDYGNNGDQMGIGIYRSQQTGQEVKSGAGQERQIAATQGGAVSLQHPDVKNGNKVEPQTKAGK